MDNNVKLLLLKVIKFNGDITPLLKLGYEYSQIVNFINDEIKENNVDRTNGLLGITEKGNKLIEEILFKDNRTDSKKWIEPEIQSKIPKIPLDSIFLPDQNELTFKIFD